MKHIALPALFTCISLLGQNGPETVIRGTKQFTKKSLITGLEGPWEVTWGPDNMLWITERTGKRVVRVNPSTGEKSVAVTIPEVSAPGGQDGLLGMALHPELLKGTGNDYVYVAYSYVDKTLPPNRYVADDANPYRYLHMKIARFTYNKADGKLSSPVDVVTGFPAGNDHNAGRLKFNPFDKKLYLNIGDQGNNQLGNVCRPVESQTIPTAADLAKKNYFAYQGKSLRINLDGSIPKDNPKINGVVSHVFTYGHRNPQGLDFGPDGTIYETEQGPKTDDEVNILKAGGNYGWPNVVGFKDDKAYQYARWAEATTPCSTLKFSDLAIHPSVPREPESAFKPAMVDPVATMFTVPSDYNFADPKCKGIDFICWPTVATSSIEYYANKGAGIPGWDKVLFVTTLKRGSLYVLPLTADGKKAAGYFHRYFQSENRYRDTAVSPDGKTIFIATDPSGLAGTMDGGATQRMQDKGSILAFTYTGEGTGAAPVAEPTVTSKTERPTSPSGAAAGASGPAPEYTKAQAVAGKEAYNANCAVCHGSTMTNGTMGTPLAGQYFKEQWSGKPASAFFTHAKTMPPANPGSLPDATYANILAYILETNGVPAGAKALPAGVEALKAYTIK